LFWTIGGGHFGCEDTRLYTANLRKSEQTKKKKGQNLTRSHLCECNGAGDKATGKTQESFSEKAAAGVLGKNCLKRRIEMRQSNPKRLCKVLFSPVFPG
jgi:hypothetical protein